MIAVTIAVAADVDAGGALPAQRSGEANVAGRERSVGLGSEEAKAADLALRADTGGIARRSVDRNHAAYSLRSPQCRLRTPDNLDPRGEIGVQQLKSRLI